MRNLAERGRCLKRPLYKHLCQQPQASGGSPTSGASRPLPPLILMTDPIRLADPTAAIAALPPGSAVLFRDYDTCDRPAAARRLHRLCRARRLLFLVGADWRLAIAVGADGLHLPEGMVRHGRRDWRHARRPGFLVTQAAHGRHAVAQAGRRGVDAVLLSPVFPTASHREARPLGPLRFALLVRLSPVPVYALGGMTGKTARRLAGIPIAGIAAIGGLSPRAPAQSSS
ncbi:MAG: thiamine phosphate synthase [Rhodospirillales bacterium]